MQGYFIGKPAPIGQYGALVGRAGRQSRCEPASQDRLNFARMADYDLAIIGGGLNGVSVARDAAGRGLRVILLEQGDLGAAASSASRG